MLKKRRITRRDIENFQRQNAEDYYGEIVPEGQHLYEHLNIFHEPTDIQTYLADCTIVSGLYLDGVETDYPIQDYLQELCDYELYSVEISHGEHTLIYGLQLMLPFDFPTDKYKDFGSYITQHFLIGKSGMVPYFLTTHTAGRCTYLTIFCSERYFYPGGKDVPKLATSTFYRNPINGQRCKPTTPGAILVCTKGEILGYENVTFTSKERIFRHTHGQYFHYIVTELRELMRDYFARQKVSRREKALFSRLIYRSDYPVTVILCSKEYNDMLEDMEKQCSDFLYAVRMGGYEDEIPTIDRFICEWRLKALETTGVLKYSRKSFKYNLSFNSNLTKFRNELSKLKEAFDVAFNKLVQHIYPQTFEFCG